MARSPLVFGMAAVFAGCTVVLTIAGLVYREPLVLLVAAPFAVSTYFFWMQATGRLAARVSRQARRARTTTGHGGHTGGSDRRRRRRPGGGRPGHRTPRGPGEPSAAEARRVLEVDSDADGESIRRAYRERVKDVHPDAPGGSERAFKRVQAAYERLSD